MRLWFEPVTPPTLDVFAVSRSIDSVLSWSTPPPLFGVTFWMPYEAPRGPPTSGATGYVADDQRTADAWARRARREWGDDAFLALAADCLNARITVVPIALGPDGVRLLGVESFDPCQGQPPAL